MFRSLLTLILGAAFLSSSPAYARKTPQPAAPAPAMAATPGEPGALPPGSLVIQSYDFDDAGGGPDPQGWVPTDLTDKPSYFHFDNLAGLGGGTTGGLVPVRGAKSLWCGVRSTTPGTCHYATLPGYGNDWNQMFESVDFLRNSGDVTVSFLTRYDLEPSYDFARVEYLSLTGAWRTLATYTGQFMSGALLASVVIPADSLGATVRARIRVTTGTWDDEDGFWPTDGAILVDSLVVRDSGGTLDFQDFETETIGAISTADGDWVGHQTGFGNYTGLRDGDTVLQKGGVANATNLWSFTVGSPATFACGGYPGEPAIPYRSNGQSFNNAIVSPWISLTTVPVTGLSLAFDVYRDLPLDALVFYYWKVRFRVGAGCPTAWRNDGFIYYKNPPAEWTHDVHTVTPYMEPLATEVQIQLGVIDMCDALGGIYGTCACHTNAPLFDNITLTGVPFFAETVVNTNDGGPGSLRDAIDNINLGPGGYIGFDIPGTGPHTIQLVDALPVINVPVVIDGYSQPGSSPNTSTGPESNAVLMVEIEHWLFPQYVGLALAGGNSLVRGLAINGFNFGINVASGGNRIEGNFIGLDPSGTLNEGNVYYGIGVAGVGNTIGGTLPDARNVVSGNAQGVYFNSAAAADNAVVGNLFGTDKTGTSAIGNGTGIWFLDGTSNVVGGSGPAEPNLIANSTGPGIIAHNGQGNRFHGNSFHSNAQLAIDLVEFGGGSPGVTLNDAGDVDTGPNGLLNFPVLATATTKPDSLVVTGSYSGAAGLALELLFYSSPACDPSGYGEGRDFIGSRTINSGGGIVAFTRSLPVVVAPGSVVTAVAIDASGNTSEFCACVVAVNTQPGSSVSVTPVDATTGTTPVTLTFDTVTGAGISSLVTAPTGPTPPGSFMLADPATYYEVSTTATFSGDIEICIHYDESQLAGVETDVRVLHYDTGLSQWVDATTSVDINADVVCGTVGSLSPFALGTGSATGAGNTPQPKQFALHANVPNPFNPTTTILYEVPVSGTRVTVRIYDVAGRLVRALVDGNLPAGAYRVAWDGVDAGGTRVASGVYFCRMEAGAFAQTRKMVLLK